MIVSFVPQCRFSGSHMMVLNPGKAYENERHITHIRTGLAWLGSARSKTPHWRRVCSILTALWAAKGLRMRTPSIVWPS
jgi:hypothetical protein